MRQKAEVADRMHCSSMAEHGARHAGMCSECLVTPLRIGSLRLARAGKIGFIAFGLATNLELRQHADWINTSQSTPQLHLEGGRLVY